MSGKATLLNQKHKLADTTDNQTGLKGVMHGKAPVIDNVHVEMIIAAGEIAEKETVDYICGQWYGVVADRFNCNNMETKGRSTRAM